jgi:hypothetical protein
MADAHDGSMNVDQRVPFHGFDPQGEVNIARRRLPHWRQSGATYFITFRLADSLPQFFRNYITANPDKAGLKPDEYSLQIRNALTI